MAVLGFLVISCAGASAHEQTIDGLVLGTRVPGRAIVRHTSYLGRPSGITTFTIVPASDLHRLRPGVSIEGVADGDATPPTLSAIRIVGAQSVTGAMPAATEAPQILRDVHHISIGEYAPSPPFVDQLGRPFTLKDFADGPVALAFIYTRCRDARECPLTSAKFRQLQSRVAGTTTHLLLVTLDPAYDRPSVLARYAAAFGADPARWRFATGDPDTILNFAAQFDVTAFPDERVGLIHPDRTILLDRFGAVREMIDESSWSADEIVASINGDARIASNPFARLNLWLSARAVAVCGNAVAGFSGFTDLVMVAAIAGFFGFLLWRVGRSIARGAA